ncbi:MAG: efflux RND transporter periplasmic adaptor subunit [Myxococcota bacterium]
MIRRTETQCLLAVVLLLGACGGEEETASEPLIRAVRYVRVAADDGGRERTFSGAVRAGNQTRLSFQVNGRVNALNIRVGQTVEEGATVASVDGTDYELQLQEARANAGQARAQARSAAATYDRIRALYANQNASRQDLDNARAQRDSAQASSAAAGQSIRRLQRQLEYATLTAPAAGTVSEVLIENNEVVSAGQTVATLQVGEQLEVAVDLPESYVNRIERGTEATIRVDAVEQAITATVYEVGVPPQGSTVFPITLRVPEEGVEGLRAGMAADVVFSFEATEEESAGFELPLSAVGEDREGRFVYIVEGEGDTGTVRRRSVEVAGVTGDALRVTDGVTDGERVVTAGVSRISDGLEVRVPPLEGEAAPEAAEGQDADETDENGESE